MRRAGRVKNLQSTALLKLGSCMFLFLDDTAMTLSVSLSLLECKSLNNVDMASRFCKEFFKEMDRGYGGGVVQIFGAWERLELTKQNVLYSSQSQFDGSGSYGNGAAMRVAPVGLFAKSVDECIQVNLQVLPFFLLRTSTLSKSIIIMVTSSRFYLRFYNSTILPFMIHDENM